MCYPKPGPRCSHHALEALRGAEKDLEQTSAPESYQSAREALERAQNDYDTTPRGLEELKSQVAQDPTDAMSAYRLELAQKTRAAQLELYTKSQGFLPTRRVRRGCNTPEDRPFIDELDEAGLKWRERLNEEEARAVSWYSMFGNESVNAVLRGEDHDFKDVAIDMIPHLSSAISKGEEVEEPRMLYRRFVVPGAKESDNPQEVVSQYIEQFQPGKIIESKGFMSTSADADYMVYCERRTRTKNSAIVFEVLSRRGAVLHEPADPHMWSILQDEREILLPAASKFEVVAVHPNIGYTSSRKTESSRHGLRPDKVRRSSRFNVVQIIDISE